MYQGQVLVHLLGAVERNQATQRSPTCTGSWLISCRLPCCWSRACELPEAWVISVCGFPHHYLNPFCSYNLFSLSSTGLLEDPQCLAVDLCICFHQLLNEDFMMIISIVTTLIPRKAQFILVMAIVKDVVSLISFSACLSFLYRRVTDFL